MLEGLEIAEINFLQITNQQLRLEAQYHTAKIFELSEYYLGHEVIKSANYNSIYGINDHCQGRLILRMHEFDGIFAGTPTAYCKNFDDESYKQHRLRKNDVLICRTNGNPKLIGKSALVAKDYEHVYESHLFKVCPNENYINSSTLTVFLNSIYGRMEIDKLSMQGNQSNFSLAKFKEIRIPKFSKAFQNNLNIIVFNSFSLKESSSSHLSVVEVLLLNVTGLIGFMTKFDKSVNIKSYKNSFGATGRFDAEYFYPAKEEAHQALAQTSDFTVGDLFHSIRSLWQPDSKTSAARVRNYDLNDALSPFLDDTKEPVEQSTIASTKKIIQGGDLVVSRLRSYLKEIAVVKPGDGTLMVASTEYIVLRPKTGTTLPVEALLVYLRSALPQLVFKWSQDGSNHPRFDEGELLRLPVPNALIARGAEFVTAIQTVIASRKRADKLLDAAKRAVEIAIEQDESAAMAYLAQEGALA